MPPITGNPRYERLCLNLVAGMTRKDAMLQAGFSEWYALSCTELIESKIIQDRIRELQVKQAQTLIHTGAIATLEERQTYLSKIVRTKPEVPVSAGHVIAASHQLNLIEKVYEPGGQNKLEIKMVTLMLNNEQNTPGVPVAETKSGGV